MQSILDAADPSTTLGLRDKVMLMLLYDCGLRETELINFKESDMRRDDGVVYIIGKGGAHRIVPIGDDTIKWIDQYIADARGKLIKPFKRTPCNLFLNYKGSPLSRQAVWNIVTKYTAEAGITKHVHPHTIRHTYATHYLESGANLKDIQALLGHLNIETTAIYLHCSTEYLKEVYKKRHAI
jgi:integrase/recombinase XerD